MSSKNLLSTSVVLGEGEIRFPSIRKIEKMVGKNKRSMEWLSENGDQDYPLQSFVQDLDAFPIQQGISLNWIDTDKENGHHVDYQQGCHTGALLFSPSRYGNDSRRRRKPSLKR
jgi:hypothetical protein